MGSVLVVGGVTALIPGPALQALGQGAREVWVQLCPPLRPGGVGQEALVWLSPVQKLARQGPVRSYYPTGGFKSTAHINF